MTKRAGMALTAGIGTLAIAATVALAQSRQAQKALPRKLSVSGVKADALEPADIVGWQQWTKVTDKPRKMDFVPTMRCVGPSLEEAQALTRAHGGRAVDQGSVGVVVDPRWAQVYVNPIGRSEMLGTGPTTARQPAGHFPVGSVLVKARLVGPNPTDAVELLTVMRKREKGWWKAENDWEYAVLSADGARVLESGRLERCASCHRENRDFGDDTFRRIYQSVR